MDTVFLVACSIVGALVITVIILSMLIVKGKKKATDAEEKSRVLLSDIKSHCEQKIKSASDKCSADCAASRKDCDDRIAAMKKECEETVRVAKEYIESHRAVLMQIPERELLADIMIALEGYGGRIERLSTALCQEQINEKFNQLTQTTTTKIDSMSETVMSHMKSLDFADKMDYLTQSIEKYMTAVDEIKSEMQDVIWAADGAKEAAEGAKDAADNARSVAEDAKDAAESSRSAADDAKDAAESARNAAEYAQIDSR
ncbi:MAG: hypothetical protein RR824_07410 [Clostridia bacterium]